MLPSIRSQSAFLILLVAAAPFANSQEAPSPVLLARVSDDAGQSVPQSTNKTFKNFLVDTVGPYPLAMAVFTAAIHQGTDNPPEWRQGAVALSKRFGSNMGITAVGNTTRYGLAAVLNEDTSYHRCRCAGVPHRLAHAAFSALMARRKSDGKRVFSVPGLAAPYASTMAATYAWYPARYGARDAFRMGNYNLLGTVGSNIAFEFIPRKAWRGLRRVHMASRRVAEDD
jgi:hypothetical protein